MLLLPLLVLLGAAPQGHFIVAERFDANGATADEVTKLREAVVSELTHQGYQVQKVEDRDAELKEAKAKGVLAKLRGADLLLSSMVAKAGDRVAIDVLLARAENRTLLASAKVTCEADLAACGKKAAEELGEKLRAEVGVRVKLRPP